MHSRGRGISNIQSGHSSMANLQNQIPKKPIVAQNPSWDDSDGEADLINMNSPARASSIVSIVDSALKVSHAGLRGEDFGDSIQSSAVPMPPTVSGNPGRGIMLDTLSSVNSVRGAASSGNMNRGNYVRGGAISCQSNPGSGQGRSGNMCARGGRSRGSHLGGNGSTLHSNFASSEPAKDGFGKNFGSNMSACQVSNEFNNPARGTSNRNHGRGRDEMNSFNCRGAGHSSRDFPQPRADMPGNRYRMGEKPRRRFTEVHWRPYNDYGPSYLPKHRTIEEIFGDDVKASAEYLAIRILDDDVSISGAGKADTPLVLIENWSEANLHSSLKANIERARYAQPRKIQSYTIPLIIEGHDLNGVAETGSGKGAAFLIPIIDTIIRKKKGGEVDSERSRPIALIIEPTREMAIQLSEQAKKLADETGVTVAAAYGKYEKRENFREISRGCDILVGTPGRLKEFFVYGYLLPDNLKFLVFDEADHILEDQFLMDLRDIALVDGFPKKDQRQTIFFSATCPEEIQLWAKEWMRPNHVFVSNNLRNSANHKIIQSFVQVSEADKMDVVLDLLKKEKSELVQNSQNIDKPRIRRTLVFMNTKRSCDVLASYLSVNGIESVVINGDQPQETRDKAVQYIRMNEVQVAVTTDVCARGIDIKDLDHVINVELPRTYATYVHRIGRTGRLKVGYATSFFNPVDDVGLADLIAKGIRAENQEVPAFLIDVSGARATDDRREWGANDRKPATLEKWD